MAGLGRRSHYRKHLTDSVLNDFPEPSEDERIAKVVGTRGSNQFELIVAPDSSSYKLSTSDDNSDVDSWDKTPQLAILPTKFRKLVWLKRNDFVICSCAKDDNNDDNVRAGSKTSSSSIEGGIRYMINHILYKEQVKHLKQENKWPLHPLFNEVASSDGIENGDRLIKTEDIKANNIILSGIDEERRINPTINKDNKEDNYDSDSSNESDGGDDGIVYDNDDIDDSYFINTNRIAKLKIDDSSSENDSD